jgi:hypothetical protein
LIARCVTNSPIFSRNFGLVAGASHRMAQSGATLVVISGSATKSVVTICRSQSANAPGGLFTNVRIVRASFHGCAGSGAQSHVWYVAARVTAANLTPVSDCSL